MARRKLTKKQKAKNKADYNRIRRIYNQMENKNKESYKVFKRIVLDDRRSGETITEAAKRIAHNRKFTDAGTVAKENILGSLKENAPDIYRELRNKAGRFNKGEKLFDRVKWNKDLGKYVLTNPQSGKRYKIMTRNSPQEWWLEEII